MRIDTLLMNLLVYFDNIESSFYFQAVMAKYCNEHSLQVILAFNCMVYYRLTNSPRSTRLLF